MEESGQHLFQRYVFLHFFMTMNFAKAEQRVHMYYEREKKGLDLTLEVCELLHMLSLTSHSVLTPGDSGRASSGPQKGLVLCIQSFLYH